MDFRTTDFKEPGTYARPRLLGRGIRIIAGLTLIYFFIKTLTGYKGYVGDSLPGGTWWIGAIISFYFLSDVVNIGFTRSWGRWPQAVALILALAAVTFNFIQYGDMWGPPLGLLVYLLMVVVLGYLGISFLLAGILAVPG
jgi:hypothetical protein